MQQSLAAKTRHKTATIAKALHTFSMEVCIDDVSKESEEIASQMNLGADQLVPIPLMIEIHKQQDFSIANYCGLIDTPHSWYVHSVTPFYDERTQKTYLHEYHQALPSMPNSEFMVGSKQKVDRGQNIKTRWAGLIDEINGSIKTDLKISKSMKEAKTMVYLEIEASFIDPDAYLHYQDLLRARSKGKLLEALETLERAKYRQELGIV